MNEDAMSFGALTEKYLQKTGRVYARRNDAFTVPLSADALCAELRLVADERGVLFARAVLPAEAPPRVTEEVITAVNSANALSNYGCFALSPETQAVTFRGYVRLRGDVEGEIAYLLEKSEKTLDKFAPALCAVCEGKLTADEFMTDWKKILGK